MRREEIQLLGNRCQGVELRPSEALAENVAAAQAGPMCMTTAGAANACSADANAWFSIETIIAQKR